MLDRRFVVENIEIVRRNCRNRGVDVDVDRFLALEQRRKTVLSEVESLNQRANQVSKSIGQAKDPAEREARKEEGRRLREQTSQLQAELDAVIAESDALCRAIPNLSHPDAPIGADDHANLEVGRGKTPLPQFDFPALDHVELAE